MKKECTMENVACQATAEMQEHETLTMWHKIIPPSILTFLTMLLYWPSLNYPFQFDDIANISKKFTIRFDNPLVRWWTHSRWFSDWLNALNFQIGRFEPFWYRSTNVMIHVLSGLFIFFLVLNLCSFLKKKSFFFDYRLLIATATAGFFLLHPVQTQTVSYVIQARQEGLATLFALATIHFFVQFFVSRSMLLKVLNLGLCLLVGIVACGIKEIVVVVPLLLLLIDWFFISQEQWQDFKKHLLVFSLVSVCFLGVFFHYHPVSMVKDVITLNTASTVNNRGNILTPDPFDHITPKHFFMSELKVIVHYITMFLWPFNISVEYDWKLAPGFFSAGVLLPLLMLIGLLLLAFMLSIRKKHTFLAFGILWFLISVLPRSSIIPSAELVCDYKTYLASVGICFILAVLTAHLVVWLFSWINKQSWYGQQRYFQKNIALQGLFLLVMIPVASAAFFRNRVWSSCVIFWADNAAKAPNKARVHNNYGVALSEAGKLDESVIAYKRAIELDKWYQDPLSNLAVAYSLQGNVDAAIGSLQAALNLCPNYPEAYNNIGSLFLQKKDYVNAERALQRAIQLRPYYGKAFFNMARLHEEKGDSQKVWEYLKKATEGDLDIPDVFFKYGLICLRVQKYEEAEQAFLTTIERGGQDQQVLFNLGNAYYMRCKYDQAKVIYEKLVNANPLDVRYVHNLAETFLSMKDYDKALALFKKSTSLPNPIPQSFMRVAACLEQMQRKPEAKSYLSELLALNAPDDFKSAVKTEIARLSIQEKLDEGGGSIKYNDFKKILAQRGTSKTT